MTKEEIIYNVSLCDIVYKEKLEIKFSDYGLSNINWIDDKKTDTQAFVAIKGDVIYVVIRGSSSKKDFQNDASIAKVPFINEGEKVHIGFKSQWEAVKGIVHNSIYKCMKTMHGKVGKVVVCGHSLGGAVATLFTHSISHEYPDLLVESCTIGSPRVGNKTFKDNYDKLGVKTYRIVHNNDVVTHSPYIGYYHVNHMLRIDDNGDIKKYMIDWERAWSYIKGIFTASNVKDHMTHNYINALNKWFDKN